jgi:hypothetical protein
MPPSLQVDNNEMTRNSPAPTPGARGPSRTPSLAEPHHTKPVFSTQPEFLCLRILIRGSVLLDNQPGLLMHPT